MTLQSNIQRGLDTRKSNVLFPWRLPFEQPKGLQLQILRDCFCFSFAITPLLPLNLRICTSYIPRGLLLRFLSPHVDLRGPSIGLVLLSEWSRGHRVMRTLEFLSPSFCELKEVISCTHCCCIMLWDSTRPHILPRLGPIISLS